MILSCSTSSYIADISTPETRTSRISLLYGFITVSLPVSMFSSIYIYTYGGFMATWGTSLALTAIAFIYLTFFLSDTRGGVKEKDDRSLPDHARLNRLLEADDSALKNVWKCFTVTFQRRSGFKRPTLCVLLLAMSLYVFASGE